MLTIGVPAYNEEATIEEVVEELLGTLPRFTAAFEILAVDDGSTDATGAILDRLAAAHPALRVIHHGGNRGFAGFGRTLLDEARGSWLAAISADGEIPPDCIGPMLERARDGADIVVGVRQNRPRYTFYRHVVSWAYNAGVRVAFGKNFRDIGGFKLYRTKVIRQIGLESRSAFINAERLIKAHRIGYRIEYVSVHDRPRAGGTAKGASLARVRRSSGDLLRIWLDVVAQRWAPPAPLPRTDEEML